jgi:hypothetical protein
MAEQAVLSSENTNPQPSLTQVAQIILPQDFRLQSVDSNLGATTPIPTGLPIDDRGLEGGKEDDHASDAELGPALALLKGTFTGPGFNFIFRPHGTHIEPLPKPDTFPNSNLLELNLTHENWSFTKDDLGDIPNRGRQIFNKAVDDPAVQLDVFLHGVPYLQTVLDITDTETGKRIKVNRRGEAVVPATKGGAKPRPIHFEPGLFLNVPKTKVPLDPGNTIARLASIPHGTAINAQGSAPVETSAAPDLNTREDPALTKPFPIGSAVILVGGGGVNKRNFPQQDVTNNTSVRLPQDLTKFGEVATGGSGEMTQKIVNNPSFLLETHNENKVFTKTVKFTVSTKARPTQNTQETAAIAELTKAAETLTAAAAALGNNSGDTVEALADGIRQQIELLKATEASGTANIAFLDGTAGSPTASAAQVTATFWLSTVQYELQVPDWTPKPGRDYKIVPLRITPKSAPGGTPYVENTVPTFVFPKDKPIKAQTITVTSTQFQYVQNVILNFNGLSWPHVSVATAVPLDDILVDSKLIK